MKRKKVFELPYIGVDTNPDYDILYGKYGEFSIVIKLKNPVLAYSGSPTEFDDAHGLFLNIIKVLGENMFIQKQDIISRTQYEYVEAEEFLQDEYNKHFEGRNYLRVETYLIVTKQVKRSAFFVYNNKALIEFKEGVGKVIGILSEAGCKPVALREREINILVKRTLILDFHNPIITLDNIEAGTKEIKVGERCIRCLEVVDIDTVDLPSELSTHIQLNDNSSLIGFPVDLFQFLMKVPNFDTILFNQMIEVPGQMGVLSKLELKKKRHSGIPDPANNLCVEDIDLLLRDVAKDNQLLVNCHFNILVSAHEDHIQKASNFIESSLFQFGITLSKHSSNQLELFRSALPGNSTEIQDYNLFLTTADAAVCLFFKEALAVDEESKFRIRFTDRQGVPIAIDPADLPMSQNRINNRNKFVLGPSGSGKSFFMNGLIEQYMLYNMDVVIVDTGHSYSGLYEYYKANYGIGKYITYSEKNPITMNPFAVNQDELNIEKQDFLNTLICLLWKGANGVISQVESDIIANVIRAYYNLYFYGKTADYDKYNVKIGRLNFNSFYEFAIAAIPLITQEEGVRIDFDDFRFVLKKFYKGGMYDTILNEEADSSLFTERFIVFEIDSIKESKVLFPIVTLIIMDVFIQKMRNRKDFRKALIIEEAWKAIASPLMASYILYLYKTVRKFWGEAIVVTQELGDIVGNTIVKDSIINNSDTICLLDQTNFIDNFDEIAALLSINAVERSKIFTINKLNNTAGRSRFKEVYIRRGSKGEVYGVEVSLIQYLTYTTEKPEKSAVETYVKYYQGDYRKGLKIFVRDFKGSKLSLQDFVTQVNTQATENQLMLTA